MQHELSDLIDKVNKVVSTYWPLQSFIATNPLWDLIDQDFDVVCQQLSPYMSLCMNRAFYRSAFYNDDITDEDLVYAIGQLNLQDGTDWVGAAHAYLEQDDNYNASPILLCEQIDTFNYQSPVKWIQYKLNFWLLQYFGEIGQGHTVARLSLFEYWQYYIIHEYKVLAILNKFDDPLSTIDFLLGQLDIAEHDLVSYFTQIICYVYGWASLIKWTHQRPNNPWLGSSADLASVLCLWLAYEWLICQQVPPSQKVLESSATSNECCEMSTQVALIWQLAYEHHQHKQLIDRLSRVKSSQKTGQADAQLVFCIDVRSEGIRRHIEAQGQYETYGFAGFFGFPFKLANDNDYTYQCPALLDPETVVHIQRAHQAMIEQVSSAFNHDLAVAKNHVTSPYALFEMVGIYKLIKLVKKTFLNQHKVNGSSYNKDTIALDAISFDEAAQAGFQLLSTIGLTDNFAQDVIICAHQSINDNNPFAAALDCGACGGNSGVPNALVASAYLNQPTVRQKIAEMGINIPETTQFIAACHYTSCDDVELFDTPANTKLTEALQRASIALRAEKSAHFVYHENNQLYKKQNDWAELIPELGLANNYALIIGPRRFSQDLNLNNRVFLHSYEPSQDPQGDILASIVAAPVIVAHWINAQYYFSTVSPGQFGAGNKALHNVIPQIGVMEGNLSDLKIGLPTQSVRYKNQLIHQPVRLLVIIYGDRQLINEVIDNNPCVKQLVKGNWICLKIIDSA